MNKYNKAFTILELLVSVSIIGVILSVVLWNYGGFNDNLAVSGAAQEMAIAIRQAQTYGINVKESAVGSNQFNYAYGIYFNRTIPSSYTLFVDIDADNRYDPGELVETVNIRDGVTVSNVCSNITAGCTTVPSAVGILVLFLRPNPDARIYFTDSVGGLLSATTGKIQLVSKKGTNKYVIIENTGQIVVQ